MQSEQIRVPWSGAEILAVVFLGNLWPALVYGLLHWSGALAWFYGPDLVELAEHAGEGARLVRVRFSLWASCLAFPLQIATALLLLGAVSGTRPEQLGLTRRRAGVNALAGLLGVLILAPGVYGVQELVLWLFRTLGLADVQEHPFALLDPRALHTVEWVLLLFSAAVVAPVWEELVFRGLLQPWVLTRPWGGPVALGAALFFAISSRWERWPAAWRSGGMALLLDLMPALTLLALVPVYLLLAGRRRPGEGPRPAAGLFAVAVLFAWVHARVWPSPLSLLWLALGLGWLAWRSRSLVGPIVLHALFNALACALLLLVRRPGSG